MQHLSSLDASFLHLETPETPMHVGSLMLLELPKGYEGDFYEDVKAMIGSRMHLSTMLTRKLATMPFDLAEPVWIEDDDIDLDYHVRPMTVRRPGTLHQLEVLIGRLHSMLLDRSRPLWEMYVIDGLENGQIAMYTKAHHSGVDGKSGAELAKVMYDASPEIRQVPPPRRKRGDSGKYQLGVTELLQAAIANSAQEYRKLIELAPTAVKALGAAANVLSGQLSAAKEGSGSLASGLAPKTVFNDSITNQRSYSTMSLPMSDLKALGKRVGGTINTIVMAMCSSAVRGYLKERGLLPEKSLIALVPVSLRAADDDSMNNQVSMIRVNLATDVKDFTERFKMIHESSEAGKALVKELKPVLGVNLPVMGAPWLMSGMASLIGRSNLAKQFPAVGNVLISNVPGPPVPLYVAGAEMVHFHPVSIPYHGNAVNITVQSYAGKLEFGITACKRVLTEDESHELIDRLRAALKEIESLPSVEAASTGGAETSPAKAKTEPAEKKPAASKQAK